MEKICLLNDSFPPLIDGVANAVVNYASVLHQDGFEPVVLTPECPGADDGVFPFPVMRYPSLDTRDLVGYMAGIPFAPKTAAQLSASDVSVLHCHCPVASAMLGRSLRDVLDVPLIMTYHTKFDVDVQKAIRGRLLQESAIRALVDNISACDEVWTVSRGAAENLRSLGFEGECIVMDNGVDLPRGRVPEEQCRALDLAYGLPADVPVFLFVGRMMWYKGLRITIQALAGLAQQQTDFRMVFIGSGQDEQEIRAFARDAGIGGKCLFLGSIRDRETLRSWYCRADLFLFPSEADTNGLVVREAAACGLASVLIEGSCAAEGVTRDRNAFLVDSNPASMAVLLSRLLEHPHAMKQAGERAADELYLSWTDAVRRAEERYLIVVDRYRSGGFPKHRKLTDEMWRIQGGMMTEIGRLLEEMRKTGEELRESVDRYIR